MKKHSAASTKDFRRHDTVNLHKRGYCSTLLHYFAETALCLLLCKANALQFRSTIYTNKEAAMLPMGIAWRPRDTNIILWVLIQQIQGYKFVRNTGHIKRGQRHVLEVLIVTNGRATNQLASHCGDSSSIPVISSAIFSERSSTGAGFSSTFRSSATNHHNWSTAPYSSITAPRGVR
jgi:hypothetical protein